MVQRDCNSTKNGKTVTPYHLFVSGPGGVGKSHIIKIIKSDTIKLLRLSGIFEPDDVMVILTAPTAVAAFNVGGMTLHSALLLSRSKCSGYQSLSHDRANTLRMRLGKLKLLIIDEISMVGCNMLLDNHKLLNEILVQPDGIFYGNVSVLAVGDLYQLPPVNATSPFSNYFKFRNSFFIWMWLTLEKTFSHNRTNRCNETAGDSRFIELLCRVRTAECNDSDIDMLKSRIITGFS